MFAKAGQPGLSGETCLIWSTVRVCLLPPLVGLIIGPSILIFVAEGEIECTAGQAVRQRKYGNMGISLLYREKPEEKRARRFVPQTRLGH